MKPTLFNPERYEPNPLERTLFCPVRTGDHTMKLPYRIPDLQKEYVEASSKRERSAIVARFALQHGLGSDNPEVWRAIHSDFIEPSKKGE